MKKKSIPKIFRRPIPAKKLEKRVLRRIHVESERNFVKSKLQKDDRERYVLKNDLSREELKRLKKCAKAVKKNRGVLVGWKAGILAVVLIAAVLFNLLLKNRLVERAAENSLQKIFNAAVDMEGTDLSLLRGSFGFTRLTIADEAEPMHNLIDLGETGISLDMGRLLTRKVILNDIICREIRFHTPRAESGALPAAQAGGESPEAATESRDTAAELKSLGTEIGRESAEQLLAKYRESLRSPQLIESVQQRYEESSQRWSSRVDEADARIATLKSQSEELMDTDVSSIDTLSEAEDYLSKLNDLQTSIKETRSSFENTYREYQDDTSYLKESRESINSAVREDIDFLKSAVGSFGSDTVGAVSAAAQPLVRERMGRIYTYGEKLLKVYNRLHSASSDKKSRFSDGGRQGTNVSFPYQNYPAFLIKHFEISTGSAGTSGFSEFRIDDLTGDQDTWEKPTTAAFSTASLPGLDSGQLSSDLVIDTRETSPYLLDSSSNLKGYRLDISSGLDALSIESLQAESDNTFQLTMQPDLSGTGKADIHLSDLQIAFSQSDSIVGDALSEILTDLDTVTLAVSFEYADGVLDEMQISSDIDTLLSDRIGEYLGRQAERAAEEVETAFYDYISDELETNELLRGEIGQQGAELLADIRSTGDLNAALEERKEAVKAEVQSKVEEGTQELKDKAREGLEGLGEELKLPSF